VGFCFHNTVHKQNNPILAFLSRDQQSMSLQRRKTRAMPAVIRGRSILNNTAFDLKPFPG